MKKSQKTKEVEDNKEILRKHLSTRRIYVVVTPVVEIDGCSIVIEKGRMAAQACHVLSKLKMWIAKIWNNGENQKEWAEVFYDTPVTTIVLKARDQKELRHVFNLAADQGCYCTTFCDYNLEKYKSSADVMTAVAIGPITKDDSFGICDYLPLLD